MLNMGFVAIFRGLTLHLTAGMAIVDTKNMAAIKMN